MATPEEVQGGIAGSRKMDEAARDAINDMVFKLAQLRSSRRASMGEAAETQHHDQQTAAAAELFSALGLNPDDSDHVRAVVIGLWAGFHHFQLGALVAMVAARQIDQGTWRDDG